MRFLLSALLCAALFSTGALAADELREDIGVAELERSLPSAAEEIYGELGADASTWCEKLDALWLWAAENSLPILRQAVKSAMQIITILLLCSAAGSLSGGRTPDFINLGGALGIAAVAAGDVHSFIGLGESTLRTLSDFGNVLLPCVAAAMAAGGNVSSAGAMYAATALFMDVLLHACTALVMPLIYVYIAAVTAHAALGGEVLKGAVSVSKWLCAAVLTVLVTAFTAYFSLSGAIASGSDAAAARIAKSAISAALPVVGKIASGAAGTVVAGAEILRSGVGVLGTLSVMAVCAGPFLALGAHYAVYKAAALLGGGLADSRLGGLIGGIGSAFGMVMGLVGCGAMMLFFALVSSMKAVSPL